MQSTRTESESDQPVVQVPVMLAAEVQDSLLMAMHDLHRLEGLINHATDNLMARFDETNALLDPVMGGDMESARQVLRTAVTELQFHDLSTQLISHITRVLQACAFRLANETMGHEEGEEDIPAETFDPQRPNPVTQSEMDAGSVDLF